MSGLDSFNNNVNQVRSSLDGIGFKQGVLSQLRENFVDFPDEIQEFQDFLDGLDSQDEAKKFMKIYQDNGNDENILEYLDPDMGEGFPIDEMSLKNFNDKFGGKLAIIDIDRSKSENDDIKAGKDQVKNEVDQLNLNKENDLNETIQEDEIVSKELKELTDLLSEKSQLFADFLNKNPNASVDERTVFIEDKYESILEQVRDSGSNADFVEVFTKLERAQVIGILNLPNLEKYRLDYDRAVIALRNNSHSIDKIRDLTNVGFTNQENVYRKGDKLISGDQIIDFGEHPPKKYIKGLDGDLQLASATLDYRPSKEYRKETRELKKGIAEKKLQIEEFDVNIQNTKNSQQELYNKDFTKPENIKSLYEEFPYSAEIREKAEALGELLDDGADKVKIDNAISNLKSSLLVAAKSKVEKLEQDQQDLKDSLVSMQDRLDELEASEQARVDRYKDRVNESDDRARKLLEIFNNAGLDIFPQGFTEEVIRRLNENDTMRGSIDLGNGYGIFEKINLAEGNMGQQDNQNLREAVARFVNKMISGNPDIPVSVYNVKNGEKGYKDRNTFITNLSVDKENGGYNIITGGSFNWYQVFENLSKPIEGSSKEN